MFLRRWLCETEDYLEQGAVLLLFASGIRVNEAIGRSFASSGDAGDGEKLLPQSCIYLHIPLLQVACSTLAYNAYR